MRTISDSPAQVNKRPLPVSYIDFVWGYSTRFSWGCFLVGASLSMAILHSLNIPMIDTLFFSFVAGLGIAGVGIVYSLKERAIEWVNLVDGIGEKIVYREPKKETAVYHQNTVTLNLRNGLGTQVISQPSPNAFRHWLKDCLENDRVEFSLRQARQRGWSDDNYQILVAQLKAIGLLHKNETKNSVPVITESGRIKAVGWLK